jgi:hypothetical protein
MNDHLFLVNFGFKAAASVMPYSGGDFVVYQRERNILKINQLIKLLTKSLSL